MSSPAEQSDVDLTTGEADAPRMTVIGHFGPVYVGNIDDRSALPVIYTRLKRILSSMSGSCFGEPTVKVETDCGPITLFFASDVTARAVAAALRGDIPTAREAAE